MHLLRAAIVCLSLVAVPAVAAAAPPALLGVQGRLAATGGGPVADGKYGLVASIYATQKGGEALWSESIVGVAVVQGLFAVQLGTNAKNALTPALFVGSAELWFGVSVDGEPDLTPTRLTSVPYAFAAHTALVADALSKPLGAEGLATGSVASDKVGFAYAGSASKGGSATSALDLQCTACVGAGEVAIDAIGTAQLADSAVTTAKLANGAVTAAKLAVAWAAADEPDGVAKMAASAAGLKCTGCVATAHLADVAVTTAKLADAAVTAPKLAANAVLTAAIADAAVTAPKIGSFAFPVADGVPFTCDATHLGWAYLEKKDTTIYVCDGKALYPILSKCGQSQTYCSGACVDTTTDKAHCSKCGVACKGGELCLASKCLNAISCHDLKVADPKLPDGVYTIDPDGAGGVAAFPIWCDMTTNGGGWSLVARMTTAGNQAHWDTGAVGLGGGHVKPDNPATQKYSDAIINLIKDKSAYIGPTPYRMRCWEGQTFVQTMWCSTQCTFHAQDSVNSGPCALCTSAFEGGLVQLGPNTGTRGLGHHHDGSQAWSMAYQRHPEEGNNSGCRNDSRGGGDGHLWVK